MTDDRNPMLERLFRIAGAALANDAFVAGVMARIDRLRRRTIIVRSCLLLVFAPIAWLLAAPLLDAARFASEVLPTSLVDIGASRIGLLLSPINSVAGAAALGFLVLWGVYKRLFG